MIYKLYLQNPHNTLLKAGYKKLGDNKFIFYINPKKRYHAIVKGFNVEVHQDSTNIETNKHFVMPANKVTLKEIRRISAIDKSVNIKIDKPVVRPPKHGWYEGAKVKMLMYRSLLRYWYINKVVKKYRAITPGERNLIRRVNKRINGNR